MMNFVLLLFKNLLFVFLFLSRIFSTEGEQIENAVVIVGNNRAAGILTHVITRVVKQEEADFTYRNVPEFQGKKVVSIDTQPCATGDEHIQEDFITTQRFTLDSQGIVVFEWFSPSSKDSVNHNAPNAMVKALEKAFEILKPGGYLVIDNHPFFAFAIEEKMAIQTHNPFTLVLGIPEYSQIYSSLREEEISETFSLFSKQAYSQSIALTEKIFKMNETAIANTVKNLMDNAFTSLTRDKANVLVESVINNPIGYMFLWGYHAFSRSQIIRDCLRKIGFDVNNTQVEFVEENPFNKRKWACLIRAVKPSEASSSTDGDYQRRQTLISKPSALA